MNLIFTMRYIYHFFFVSYWKFVQNDTTDVLEDHRTRNHAVRPLDITANEHPNEDDDINLGESASVRGDNTENDEPTQRAPRYSKTPRDAEAKVTTLKYYLPLASWQAMLKLAKNNMRRHIALVNAFPLWDRDLKEATLILRNTITEYERI